MMNTIGNRVSICTAFAVVLVGCATEPPATPTITSTVAPTLTATVVPTATTTMAPTATAVPIGDAERGRLIFNGEAVLSERSSCAGCHALDGVDGESPSLQGIAEVAGERVPDLTAEMYLRESILDPQSYVVDGYGSDMGGSASWRYLVSEEDINDLIAFMLSQ